jgi:hypothetical protein
MSLKKNDRDIELLKKNPKELIVSLQYLIEIIINQFIKVGKFSQSDRKDIQQQVNEELLKKITRIQKQFNYKSLVRTYMTVIIRNICNDIDRSKKKAIDFVLDEHLIIKDYANIINSIIIGEEIKRLDNAINLYHKQKFKLLLCLKLYYRIPVEFKDFKLVDRNINIKEYKIFIQNIDPYLECNDYDIFNSLITIFNKIENKKNTPDALRKWTHLKVNELIALLNGNTKLYFYSKESFQMLFEYCYAKENILSSKIY